LTKVGVALLRIVVGFVFLVHGWDKFAVGFDEVSAGFAGMGIPWPMPTAVAVALVEILGGGALFLGLWTRVAAALLMIVMLSAIYFAHWTNGFFAAQGGFEYALVMLSALLLFEFAGPGAPAIDQFIGRGAESDDSTETEPGKGAGEAGLA